MPRSVGSRKPASPRRPRCRSWSSPALSWRFLLIGWHFDVDPKPAAQLVRERAGRAAMALLRGMEPVVGVAVAFALVRPSRKLDAYGAVLQRPDPDQLVEVADSANHSLTRARAQPQEPGDVRIGGGDEGDARHGRAQSLEHLAVRPRKRVEVGPNAPDDVVGAADEGDEVRLEVDRRLELPGGHLGARRAGHGEVAGLEIRVGAAQEDADAIGPALAGVLVPCREAVAECGPATDPRPGGGGSLVRREGGQGRRAHRRSRLAGPRVRRPQASRARVSAGSINSSTCPARAATAAERCAPAKAAGSRSRASPGSSADSSSRRWTMLTAWAGPTTPISASGQAKTRSAPSPLAFMWMSPPPYALPSTTVTFGTLAAAKAWSNPAPKRMPPCPSCRVPGRKPGVSQSTTSGIPNRSQVPAKLAAI